MKKLKILTLILICFALLTACGKEEELPPATTVPTEPPRADIGGTLLELDTQVLDLTVMEYELDTLVEAASGLEQVRSIRLGVTNLTAGQISAIEAAYPLANVEYQVSLFGQALDTGTRYLDLSAMAPEQTDELIAALPLLPHLEHINFVTKDGRCVYGLEDIPELDKVRAALPGAYLQVSFELFGQTVTSEDKRIEYYRADIGNEGIDTIRSVLPYLSSCTYFLMDGCGVDNEIMARLREDFPETKIVWRIWLVEPDYSDKVALRAGSYLTDTHRVRTTMVTDKNSHLLNYCIETKYVDVGHVWALTQCEFLAYMPDLEACIIAITEITDISPLANHDKLEYLELFTTDIQDISALASCPNLEHLNISNMPLINDISPLYGLTKLKRLRMVTSPMIPDAQKDEIEQLLPNCQILKGGYFPTAGNWRYIYNTGVKTERYALLCEQMEYSIDAWEYGIP